MTRVKVSFVILLCIVAYSVMSYIHVSNSTSTIVSQLDIVSTAYEEGSDELDSELKKLDSEWQNYYKRVIMFVNSDALQEVEVSFIKIKPLIENENSDFLYEVDNVKYLLEMLLEGEFPHYYNVL